MKFDIFLPRLYADVIISREGKVRQAASHLLLAVHKVDTRWARIGHRRILWPQRVRGFEKQKTRKASGRAGLMSFSIGARYWDRTSDPRRVKAMLYR